MNSTLENPVLADAGSEAIDVVMRIMDAAFDQDFGEAWTREQCLGVIGLPGVWLTLATYKGEVVGFTLGRFIVDDAELLLIAVVPDVHGQGIGSVLLQEVINRALTLGASKLHLEVREGNHAFSLYRKMNFTPAGRRARYYRGKTGQSFDALTLTRPLNPVLTR